MTSVPMAASTPGRTRPPGGWALEMTGEGRGEQGRQELGVYLRVVRPGVVLILERVAAARTREETWTRVANLLSDRRRAELDNLVVVDTLLGCAPLAWLGVAPASLSPAAVRADSEKLAFLRGVDAHTLDRTIFAKPAAAVAFLFVNRLILLAGERLRRTRPSRARARRRRGRQAGDAGHPRPADRNGSHGEHGDRRGGTP